MKPPIPLPRPAIPAGIGTPLIALAGSIVGYAALRASFPDAFDSRANAAIWPATMLIACIGTAGLLLARRIWRHWHARRDNGAVTLVDDAVGPPDSDYDNRKTSLGLLGIVLYGVALPYIGFAFATAALIVYWLIMDGLRKPMTVALTAILGTIGMLYLFVKVTYAPLPRGEWFFDDMTVAIYRALGIF